MKTATYDVDQMARFLGRVGHEARHAPPAWRHAHVAPLVCGPSGEYIGRYCMGKGLVLAHDLRTLGITRPIPHVHELSPILKVRDRLRTARLKVGLHMHEHHEEIAAVALVAAMTKLTGLMGGAAILPAVGTLIDLDGVIASRGNGKTNDTLFSKTSFTTVAAVWHTVFRAGGTPAAGSYTAIPGGAAMTRASTGALNFGMWNTASTDKKYLLGFGLMGSQTWNMAWLVDLLVAAGTINAASNTVNSTAITRNYTPDYGATPGPGVMMTFEITTQLGASIGNIQASSYTDQDGNAAAASASTALTASGIVQRLQPANTYPWLDLASGDFGVRSVETVTLGGTLGGSVLALNLFYPLVFLPGVGSNVYVEMPTLAQFGALQTLAEDGSRVSGCLTLYVMANTTTLGNMCGRLVACAG